MPSLTYRPKRKRLSDLVSGSGYNALIPVDASKTQIIVTLAAVAVTNNDTPAFFYVGTGAPPDDLDSVKLTAPAKDGTSGTNTATWTGAPLHLEPNDGVWAKGGHATNAVTVEAHYMVEQ